MSWWSARCCRRTRCSPTRPHCRCWIPAGERPRPAASGVMQSMIGPGLVPLTRQQPMCTPKIAGVSTRPPTWPHSKARCRWTAMPASAAWLKRARMRRSGWLFAGHICGARSTRSTPPPSHRSRPKRWHALPSSTRSKATSVANRPMCAKPFVTCEVDRWSTRCTYGCKSICRACPAGQTWRKPCAIPYGIGTD
jgi:hypothetical protein